MKKFGRTRAKEIIINQLLNEKYKGDFDAYFKETERLDAQDRSSVKEFQPKDSLFESKLSKW